ncbi:MAG TPA: hypothetical protein DEB06_04900 [Phycisphaerales bacterium]|nr:hypothetical protein [Phycisphaerales bacterium]
MRLSDLSSTGRVAPGTGRLDLLAFAVAVGVSGYSGHAVLDLRGVAGQEGAARGVVDRLGRARQT